MKGITAAVFTLTLLLYTGSHALAGELDSMRKWQMELLFNPVESQLTLENKGRVFIYDSLKSSDIDRALEEQFDRIEHMMFVKTVITDEQGMPVRDETSNEILVEDDGCD